MLLENVISDRGIVYGEYRIVNDAPTDCRPVIALSHRKRLKRKKEILIYKMLLACFVRAIETRSTDTTRSLSLQHPSDSNQFVATFFPSGPADVRGQMIEINLKFRSAVYRCHLVNSGGLTATIKSPDRHRQISKAGRMSDRAESTG